MCLEIKKECILLKVFIGAKNNKHKGNSTWRGKKWKMTHKILYPLLDFFVNIHMPKTCSI